MPDHLAPNAFDGRGLRTDRVDPLGTGGGRLEVEERVVRLRPQVAFRVKRGSARPHTPARELDESGERRSHCAPNIAFMRIAELAAVNPLFDADTVGRPDRSRRRKAGLDQSRLHLLNLPEKLWIEIERVHLQRDPRASLETEAERRTDTATEREDLFRCRLELPNQPPDLLRIKGAENIEDDRRLRIR